MKISNSQIMSFQKCQKRFYFEHVLKLKPKAYPAAMEKGIFGHRMMENFFRKMQEGGTYEECVEAINPLLTEDVVVSDKVSVYRHVLALGAYVFAQPWRVVQCEDSMLTPINTDARALAQAAGFKLEFAFTIDVIFEWTAGPKKGRKFAVDFKFTGQYWSEREIGVYQQLPKYMIYTNEMGIHQVSALAVIMLNTRASAAATGTGLFQVKWVSTNKAKLQTIKSDNERLMHQIAVAKLSYKPEDYIRTVDSYQCKMCFFADDLCPADLEGRETKRYIERLYEVNTYFDDNYANEPKELSQ